VEYEDVITVACANVHQQPADLENDLTRFKKFIREAAAEGANLIIFPEVTLTPVGAPTDKNCEIPEKEYHETAETIPGPSTEVFVKEARKHDIYIIAGLLEKDRAGENILYNTAIVVGPEEGLIGTHRKVHLFRDEKAYTTPGNDLPVFETRFGPIGVLICADFYCYPEAARTCALKGARLIALVTAVMVTISKADSQWSIYEGAIELVPDIIRVRAYENHIYIAAANSVGVSLHGYRSFGKSMIVGPEPPGSFAVKYFAGPASQVKDELIMATLNLNDMDKKRQRLWDTRFPKLYGAIVQE
jgi:predicted amidohydrolase